MNLFFLVDIVIFSVFFTFFVFEISTIIASIVSYGDYTKSIRRLFLPLWEIIGTFAVFYVVNFEATFPTLLNVVGYIFIVPVLSGALLFILRNIFLVYSEYESDGILQKKYVRAYAVATLFAAFITVSIFSSGLSGIGVNVSDVSINLLGIFFNGFNLLVFVSVALLSVFLSVVYFRLRKIWWLGILSVFLSIALMFLGSYLYAPLLLYGLSSYSILFGTVIAILLVDVMLFLLDFRFTRYLSLAWVFLAVLFVNITRYPYVFGVQANILSYLNNSAISYFILLITVIGGALLVVSLFLFVWISYLRGNGQKGKRIY